MKNLMFLSGLPRTGSTLLTSLLNQHPEIYASGSSPLSDLIFKTDITLQELDKVYNFLDIKSHTNTFYNIENACGEKKDEEWGLRGLHDIRPNLSKISQNPIDIIGEENVKIYSKFDI
jgi:hypothetical protein